MAEQSGPTTDVKTHPERSCSLKELVLAVPHLGNMAKCFTGIMGDYANRKITEAIVRQEQVQADKRVQGSKLSGPIDTAAK